MELRVEIVKLGPVERHPNADSLSITRVYDYPVLFRTGEFNEGDLAIYVPIDAKVPFTDAWAWLHQGGEKNCRVQAKKLRGVFSMGLLVPLPEHLAFLSEGTDVKEQLGITKGEPKPHGPYISTGPMDSLPAPAGFPKYTDIENLLRWPGILTPGEPVVIMEKIHGANWRAGWDYSTENPTFYVGSHSQFRKAPKWGREDEANVWWKAALQERISDKLFLTANARILLFGEVYGPIQKGFDYGYPDKSRLVIFDAYDTKNQHYLDSDALMVLAADLDLTLAPVIYEGPWEPELKNLAEGLSKLDNKTMREGFVVRPALERWHERVGRVIFKHLNPEYLLLKKGSDGK